MLKYNMKVYSTRYITRQKYFHTGVNDIIDK